jgi:DNA modification methylase
VTPHHQDDAVTLYAGDCLDVLRELPDASVDAVVTDPPYGLGFMGKAWDAAFMTQTTETRRQYPGDPSPKAGENGGYRSAAAEAGRYDLSITGNRAFGAWCEQWATECLRVLKPGGHLLAFGGTRTWHRLACAIEDAGFEVRDSIAWLYGSGFPKSLDVSKAIDKAAGAEREVVGQGPNASRRPRGIGTSVAHGDYTTEPGDPITAPATDDARTWQGWGTALKPAHEPIVVARKPLSGTVAQTVLAHGTGALNIDATRIPHGDDVNMTAVQRQGATSDIYVGGAKPGDEIAMYKPGGRWPANVVLDPDAAAELDRQSGNVRAGGHVATSEGAEDTATIGPTGLRRGRAIPGVNTYTDQGGASRFFYVAKAPTAERPRADLVAHPTVKPLDLMRWLVRLVTPPGGVVLDPFAGSGTTAEACVVEGFRCITVEREPDYLPLIVARLSKPIQPDLFGGDAA